MRPATRVVAGATLLTGLTLALLPGTVTSAAWNDDAVVRAAGVGATSVPRPVLTCTEGQGSAVISWPQGALPGAGTPPVTYTARVAETGDPLTVEGKDPRHVTFTPRVVLLNASMTWTVEVTASSGFNLTTWTAVATQQVVVTSDRKGTHVACVK